MAGGAPGIGEDGERAEGEGGGIEEGGVGCAVAVGEGAVGGVEAAVTGGEVELGGTDVGSVEKDDGAEVGDGSVH